jgi:hypothetical protein
LLIRRRVVKTDHRRTPPPYRNTVIATGMIVGAKLVTNHTGHASHPVEALRPD